METSSERIVIVGGGAGGLELAALLARRGQGNVALVDDGETHVWKPRLHELATGLGRSHVNEVYYTQLARRWGFAFQLGALRDVEPSARTITLAEIRNRRDETLVPERTLDYRVLVLALGGVTPDLGVEGVLEHAILLDRESDADALARRVSSGLLARSLSREENPFHIVIVGSGLTGAELSAHLASDSFSTALEPLADNPGVDITVLEAAETFMPGMNDRVRESVRERLRRIGVTTETNRQVSRVSAEEVETSDGSIFPADLTVWAAGRVGPPVAGNINALSHNKKRQWRVRRTLQSIDSDAIFVLGDCGCIDEAPAPPTAQAAHEQAQHLARELPRFLRGEQPENFQFKDKGTLLSLGAGGSVGTIRGLFGDDFEIRGRLARAAYRGLERQHQFTLLGLSSGTAKVVSDAITGAVGPSVKLW